MYDILVNKSNLLDKDYIPDNLIITDNNENNFHNYKDPTLKPMIVKYILSFFIKMQEDMKKEGLFIIVDSGYRSYNYQQIIYNENIKQHGIKRTKRFVALPGSSEHQTGLAIDIALIRNGKYIDNIKESDPEVKWLIKNSYKYGFILRYPKGKERITGYSFEPWHYRFVGIELATFLKNENITLEEYYFNKDYYDKLKNNKQKTL